LQLHVGLYQLIVGEKNFVLTLKIRAREFRINLLSFSSAISVMKKSQLNRKQGRVKTNRANIRDLLSE